MSFLIYIDNYIIYIKSSAHVSLKGEGLYNLNVVKDIKVTDSFTGLDIDVRNCQIGQIFEECTTKHFMEKMKSQGNAKVS